MNFSDANLRRLDLATPELILRTLGRLAAEAAPSEVKNLPRATLSLAGGHVVAGKILRFEPHASIRPNDVILVHLDDAITGAEICYVPFAQVIAVTLRLSEAHLEHFSSGRIRQADATPAGRLGLEREARNIAERWSGQLDRPLALEIDWTAWPDDDDHRRVIADSLAALDDVIGKWTNDAMAREAAQALDRVTLTIGDERAVNLTQRRLLITLDRRPAHLAAPGADGLRRDIERCL
ncbi:MAG TPA: hypothetical protein VKT76_12445 [Bradyrhizobium sp.]|nr:hypothetical protein [Bradyrhizobium sp.]